MQYVCHASNVKTLICLCAPSNLQTRYPCFHNVLHFYIKCQHFATFFLLIHKFFVLSLFSPIFSHFWDFPPQAFGTILDVEIIFNERGSKVRSHNPTLWNRQLRARRALLQIKDVPLRTRRALLPLTLYSNSALLVLNRTSLSCNNNLRRNKNMKKIKTTCIHTTCNLSDNWTFY